MNEEIDLFEHYKTLPQEVQNILAKYDDGDNTYENCQNLVNDLETVGYTCNYDLSAMPYGLRKLVLDCPLCNCALTNFIEDSTEIRECEACGAEWEKTTGEITLNP